MKIICKIFQAFGVLGFMIAISADIEDVTSIVIMGALAIISLIVGLTGWKGEQFFEDHKIHDYTSKPNNRF